MAYKIKKETCIACGSCEAICPQQAIARDTDGKEKINPDICISCGMCAQVCPVNAIDPE
jgi:ferredoxin